MKTNVKKPASPPAGFPEARFSGDAYCPFGGVVPNNPAGEAGDIRGRGGRASNPGEAFTYTEYRTRRRKGDSMSTPDGTFTRAVLYGILLMMSAMPVQAEETEDEPKSAEPSILLARPENMAVEGRTQSEWFGALAEALFYFRLESVDALTAFPYDKLRARFTAWSDLSRDIDQRAYLNLAEKNDLTHIVFQTYEVMEGEGSVQYLLELYSCETKANVITIDTLLQLQRMSSVLDGCMLRMLDSLGVSVSEEAGRFFRLAALSGNVRNLRQLGATIIKHRYSSGGDAGALGAEYTRAVARDSRLHLAAYLGATVLEEAEQYEKAAQLLDKLLLTIGKAYPSLYASASRDYRLAGRYDDAVRIALLGDKLGVETPELLVQHALALQKQGKDDRAEDIFLRILEQDANQKQALLYLARRANQEREFSRAAELAERLLRNSPTDGHGYLEKGKALSGQEKNPEAIAALKRAADLLPRDPTPHALLGDLYSKQGEHAAAAQSYDIALKESPEDLPLHLKTVRALREAGMDRKALAVLEKGESVFTSRPSFHREKGLLHYRLGETDAARKHLEAFVQGGKQDSKVLTALGAVYLKDENYEGARRTYERALPLLESRDARDSCRLALARIHIRTQQPDRAVAPLKAILADKPAFPGANRMLGDAYLALGKKDDALDAYLAERRHTGETGELTAGIARLYYDAENWDKAEEAYRELLKSDRTSAPIHFRLALIYLRSGDMKKAREYFSDGLDLGEPDAALFCEFGNAYASREMTEDAVEAFHKCTLLQPDRAGAWKALGEQYEAASQPLQAARCYEKLYELDNSAYAEYLARAGHLYYEHAQDRGKAESLYRGFLEKGIRDAEVNVNLAHIKYEQKDYAAVISLLTAVPRALESGEKERMILAESYFARKEYDKALVQASAVVSSNPGNVRAVELGALSAEKAENLDAATEMYEKFLASPSTERHRDYAYHLGELYEKRGRKQQALARYRKNTATYPDDPRNFEQLGRLYLNAKDYSSARSILIEGHEVPGASKEMSAMLVTARAHIADRAYEAKNRRRAEQEYLAIIKIDQTNARAHLRLARIYLNQGKMQDAQKYLNLGMGLGKPDAEILEEFARAFREQSKPKEAMAAYRKVIELAPRREEAYLELAALQRNQGLHEAAGDTYRKLYELDNDTYRGRLAEAGELYEKADKPAKAVNAYETFLSKGYKSDDVSVARAALAYEDKEYGKVVSLLEGVKGTAGSSGNVLMMLAHSYFETGNYAKALSPLASLRKVDPDNARAVELSALAYERVESPAQACTMYEKYLSMPEGEKNKDYAFRAGQLYEARKMEKEAVERYRKNMALFPGDLRNHKRLVTLYLAEDNHKDALSVLEKAVEVEGAPSELREKAVAVRRRIADAYFDAKQWQSAEREYRVLEQATPRDRTVLLRLTRIYLHGGEIGKAEEYLGKVRAVGEPDAETLLSFARALADADRSAGAIELYRACLEKDPRNENALKELADLQRAAGRHEEAARSYAALFEFDNDAYKEDLIEAGRLFEKAGRTSEATKAYRRFLEKGYRNPDVNVKLARSAYNKKQHRGVIELLQPVGAGLPGDTDLQLMLAESYVASGDHRKALEPLKRILARQPNHLRALELAAAAYEKTGELKQASLSYARYLKVHPEGNVDYAFRLGRLYEKRDMTRIAVSQYTKNTKAYPDDVRSYERLALLHTKQKHYRSAQSVLGRAVKLPDAPPRLERTLAELYALRNQTTRAARTYERYLEKVPTDTTALRSLGELHYETKDYPKAIEVLSQAAALLPGDPRTHCRLGMAHLHTGEPNKAVSPLQRAHQLDSGDPRPLKALAECYRKLDDNRGSIDVLEKLAALEPENFDLKYELGTRLIREGRRRQAAPVLESAVALKAGAIEVHLKLVEVYRALGNEDKVRIYLEEALKQDPSSGEIHRELGNHYAARGNDAKSTYHLSRAVEQEPKNARARYEYGRALEAQGNLRTALAQLASATKLDPDRAEYAFQFSRLAAEMNREKDALRSIRRAMILDSEDPRILALAGSLLWTVEQDDTAQVLLETALKKDRSCASCYHRLGDIHLAHSSYEEAAGYYDKAAGRGEEDTELLLKLGEALHRADRLNKAERIFERVLGEEPGNDEARCRLSHIYLKDGKADQAERLLRERGTGTRSGWYYLLSGRINEENGREQKALEEYLRAAKEMPRNVQAHAGAGRMCLELGKYNRATVHFSKAQAFDVNNAELMIGLGNAYGAMENYASARTLFEEALKLESSRDEACYGLARLESAQGNPLKAIEMLKKGLDYNRHSAKLYVALGDEYRSAHRHDDATRAYKNATRRKGLWAVRAHKRLGDLYYSSTEDRGKAKRHYEKYLKEGGTDTAVSRRLESL